MFLLKHISTRINLSPHSLAKIKEAETIIEMNPPLEELDEQGEEQDPFNFIAGNLTLSL